MNALFSGQHVICTIIHQIILFGSSSQPLVIGIPNPKCNWICKTSQPIIQNMQCPKKHDMAPLPSNNNAGSRPSFSSQPLTLSVFPRRTNSPNANPMHANNNNNNNNNNRKNAPSPTRYPPLISPPSSSPSTPTPSPPPPPQPQQPATPSLPTSSPPTHSTPSTPPSLSLDSAPSWPPARTPPPSQSPRPATPSN